jgi:regulator of nucleoside diphosphate kinase
VITTTTTAPSIIITDRDLQRLLSLLDHTSSAAAESLDAELQRATVVRHTEVPADVVTMNSDVVYEDLQTNTRRTVRVVFPKDADASKGWVSVLAPIGSALLGLKVGQEIDWKLPTGNRRVRVVEVRYQPEAAGDYDL